MGVSAAQFGEFVAAWISFMLVAVSSSQVARIFPKIPFIRLPLITGYLFFGVLAGPYMLNLVTPSDISYLKPINQFALAFISLSAGVELYLPELRSLFKRILYITLAITVVVFIPGSLVFFGLAQNYTLIPFMASIDSQTCRFSISLIAASILVTQSPSSTIAIVSELRAKGPFTSTMMGVCVLIDIVVLVIYSLAADFANAVCVAGEFSILDILIAFASLGMAGVFGWIFGKIILFLIWVPRIPGDFLVLPLGYGVFYGSLLLNQYSTQQFDLGINLDPLLICIAAGYVTSNQSKHRRKFLHFMTKAGPIVFIPFFTLTGSALNLQVMGQCFAMAVILSIVRVLGIIGGSVVGAKLAKDVEPAHTKTFWLSMVTQAGVSLGIAAEVAVAFPDWGPSFQSAIIAVVVINQVIGPILLKMVLRRHNEDGKASSEHEELEHGERHRALIIGVDNNTLALAQRLINADWNVLFMDESDKQLALTDRLIVPVDESGSHENEKSINNENGTKEEKDELTSNPEADDEESSNQNDLNLPDSEDHKSKIKEKPVGLSADERVSVHQLEVDSTHVSTTGHAHRDAYLAALSKAFEHLSLDSNKIHSCIVRVAKDDHALAVSTFLSEYMHLSRVSALINNPAWSQLFSNSGVSPVSAFSSTTNLLFAATTAHDREIVYFPPEVEASPLPVKLSSIIEKDNYIENSETKHGMNFAMSKKERANFESKYPGPPHEDVVKNLLTFDEGLRRVVPASLREDFLTSIVHHHDVELQIDENVQAGRNVVSGSLQRLASDANDRQPIARSSPVAGSEMTRTDI